MTSVVVPVALGVTVYVLTAVGGWALSFLVLPDETAIAIYPLVVSFLPLLLAGFVAAKYTRSSYRNRKMIVGIVAGMIGFIAVLWTAEMPWSLRLVFVTLAALIASAGALLGARSGNAC